MYPKTFFERFWASKQRNELFVCMPFHKSLDSRYNNVYKRAATNAKLDKATRVKEDVTSDEIKTKILDGIANSKLILVDLCDDPKTSCEHKSRINGNVLYEAGIAHAMREREDIIMIRDKEVSKVDFDLRGMTIHIPSDGKITVEWLQPIIEEFLELQNWSKSNRVGAAAQSIDDIGLGLMILFAKRPKGWNHFNTKEFPTEVKVSIYRLLDLGILWFDTAKETAPSHHAYHWSQFGLEVVNHLGIKVLKTEEEFKKEHPQEYQDAKSARERYDQGYKEILRGKQK